MERKVNRIKESDSTTWKQHTVSTQTTRKICDIMDLMSAQRRLLLMYRILT